VIYTVLFFVLFFVFCLLLINVAGHLGVLLEAVSLLIEAHLPSKIPHGQLMDVQISGQNRIFGQLGRDDFSHTGMHQSVL
jgi:hypothetical protein